MVDTVYRTNGGEVPALYLTEPSADFPFTKTLLVVLDPVIYEQRRTT